MSKFGIIVSGSDGSVRPSKEGEEPYGQVSRLNKNLDTQHILVDINMMRTTAPRIFADFHNTDTEGRVRLTCKGTMEDIERDHLNLYEGQHIIIYSEELEVKGVVEYSEEENIWVAVIDWDAIKEM